MSNPLHQKDPKAHERPPIPLPDPDEVRHTFDVAMAKVRERQGFYVAMAAIVLLATIGVIFVLNLGPSAPPNEFASVWRRADAVKRKLAADESARSELAALEAYLPQVRGTKAEGEALWLLGICYYREAWTSDKATAAERKPAIEKAIGFLTELEQPKFDELLITKQNWFTSSAVAPTAALLKQARADLDWVDANAYTEPLPNPDVVAVLRTSEGDVHIQFFPDLCPEHVKNFITLARKGTYNETLFHFARKGDAAKPLGVMGGDPYTFFYNDPNNKAQILRWGNGGVGYEVPPEGGRYRIAHRAGIVTSQMSNNADWDNGSQFMLMTGTDIDLDKQHTPFAKVVEGQGIVDRIAGKTTAGEHAPYKDDADFSTIATRDLIVAPATLHKVIVYEKGKAMDHDFPLLEGERSLASLSSTPVQPLEGDAAYCGRLLRSPDGAGEIRLGLDVPFPDGTEIEKADPKGERIQRDANTGPQDKAPSNPEKPAEEPADEPADGSPGN
ncbi:MAG TPA: peptidylprolyl isomerase [Planctomycetota bacterium]|nr:peptidylprolyl isomerase [Planctomycetota bacterium]